MLASTSAANLTSQLLTGAGSSTNLYQQPLASSTSNLMGLPGLLPGASSTSSLAAGSDARLLSEALLMRRPAASTGDLASLQGAALMGGDLRGIGTGNGWGGQGLRAPWSGSVPDLQLAAQHAGLAPWQLQEAAAQLRNQQALLGLEQSASMDNLMAMNNPAHAALLLQAMNNINAQHVLVRNMRWFVLLCYYCAVSWLSCHQQLDRHRACVRVSTHCDQRTAATKGPWGGQGEG